MLSHLFSWTSTFWDIKFLKMYYLRIVCQLLLTFWRGKKVIISMFAIMLLTVATCLFSKLLLLQFLLPHTSAPPLTDRAQHRLSLPRRSPSPIPPVSLRGPRCNHGGDEDEVPLREEGEAGPGTVAPLLECHSGRGPNLLPGVPPQDGAPQTGRGTFQNLLI